MGDSPAPREDGVVREPIDSAEVFNLVRHIKDPEHPLSLEDLKVCAEHLIKVDDARSRVNMTFTPTVPNCSMATLIGLCICIRLRRTLPRRFKIDVKITPETHRTEDAINKQLADKERVAAAMENPNLRALVDACLETCYDESKRQKQE